MKGDIPTGPGFESIVVGKPVRITDNAAIMLIADALLQTRATPLPAQLTEAGSEAVPQKPARRKYRNTPTDGYASAKEAKRAGELALLEMAGKITDLREQVRFPLIVNDVLVCNYDADFVYNENGEKVVEDVKSVATRKNRAYRIKCKLLRACYGITIRET